MWCLNFVHCRLLLNVRDHIVDKSGTLITWKEIWRMLRKQNRHTVCFPPKINNVKGELWTVVLLFQRKGGSGSVVGMVYSGRSSFVEKFPHIFPLFCSSQIVIHKHEISCEIQCDTYSMLSRMCRKTMGCRSSGRVEEGAGLLPTTRQILYVWADSAGFAGHNAGNENSSSVGTFE